MSSCSNDKEGSGRLRARENGRRLDSAAHGGARGLVPEQLLVETSYSQPPVSLPMPKPPSLPCLGAHVSTSGGCAMSIERALTVGCTAMQIFVKNNMQWFASPAPGGRGGGLSGTFAAAGTRSRLRAYGLSDQSRGHEPGFPCALAAQPAGGAGARGATGAALSWCCTRERTWARAWKRGWKKWSRAWTRFWPNCRKTGSASRWR